MVYAAILMVYVVMYSSCFLMLLVSMEISMGIGYPSLAGMGAVSPLRSLAGLAGMGSNGDRGGDGGVSPGDPCPHRHFELLPCARLSLCVRMLAGD
jgi:hypothetical protein